MLRAVGSALALAASMGGCGSFETADSDRAGAGSDAGASAEGGTDPEAGPGAGAPGDVIWFSAIGAERLEQVFGLAVDSRGSVIVIGSFSSTSLDVGCASALTRNPGGGANVRRRGRRHGESRRDPRSPRRRRGALLLPDGGGRRARSVPRWQRRPRDEAAPLILVSLVLTSPPATRQPSAPAVRSSITTAMTTVGTSTISRQRRPIPAAAHPEAFLPPAPR
jgi:hypothetical protein